MLKCRLCAVRLKTVPEYVRHCQQHSTIPNARFPCPFDQCEQLLATSQNLYTHVYRNHENTGFRPKQEAKLKSNTCGVELCGSNFNSSDELLKHLRWHIAKGDTVQCPYPLCDSKYSNRSSFSSHISRAHPKNPDFDTANKTPYSIFADPMHFSDELLTCDLPTSSDFDVGDEEHMETQNLRENYVTNFELFYLKLHSKHFLPSATIDFIISHFASAKSIENELTTYAIRDCLSKHDVDSHIVEDVCQKVLAQDAFSELHNSSRGQLRSDYMRKKAFKEHFRYIEPVSTRLAHNESQEIRHYHYVPLLDNLRNLFMDPAVLEQFDNPLPPASDGLFADYTDGAAFKNNKLRLEMGNEKFIHLLLYQDAFEIVNPLGSAKSKHKVIGTYYTLGNLHPHNRSKIDPIQLVSLVKADDCKFFGQSAVSKQLIDDLKILETEGVELVNGRVLRGTVIAFLGDNLGSHGVGGFQESFGRTEYPCRFCLITSKEYKAGIHDSQKRTQKSYDDCAKFVTKDPSLAHKKGIKIISPFHDLKYFHVCAPGLPPCLAHDLFEGVVQYDVALVLKHLVKKKKWFSYDQLNRRLRRFIVKGVEAGDKPNRLSADGTKLGGSAVQNWTFLRMLPLIIEQWIQDTGDASWQLLLLLREVTELICAPQISATQVTLMDQLILDYLQKRMTCFPDVNLRPKHHFLRHYGQLTLQFGPLIRLWTLRMESKHTFFKRCARHAQNYINITRTLSERHQMLQAYYSSGSLFSYSETENEKTDSVILEELSNAERHQMTFLLTERNLQRSSSVVIRGTKYSQGHFVTVQRQENGAPLMGRIKCVIETMEGKIYLLLTTFSTKWLYELGLLELQEPIGTRCVAWKDLLDHQCLAAYCRKSHCQTDCRTQCKINCNVRQVIALKHAIMDSGI